VSTRELSEDLSGQDRLAFFSEELGTSESTKSSTFPKDESPMRLEKFCVKPFRALRTRLKLAFLFSLG